MPTKSFTIPRGTPLDLLELLLSNPDHAVFSFVGNDGANVHVDVTGLRAWVADHLKELEIVFVPVDFKMAQRYVAENTVVLARVAELAMRLAARDVTAQEPLLYLATGTFTNGAPDVMHADGHHRYVMWAGMYFDHAPAILLSPAQWEPFRIALPDLTAEELRALPVARRNY